MLLTRIYLRNFRVYEEELDLELPPGLVGIYGPNGSGKSTLLEAILFTLWGRSRTAKEEIRSAGVAADCLTEITFEHEGHLYVVRRNLTGINSMVRAEAHCDGLIMSEGVRDTTRYLHSVLGMDDAAFRASVFAEQKQLAAFSSQSPADRRRLVLQLLGITPLDAARDAARKDARATTDQHQKLRGLLSPLDALTVAADDADARAAASEAAAADEEASAATARLRLDEAASVMTRLDRLRQRHEALVAEGRVARVELDRTEAEIRVLHAERHALDQAAIDLAARTSDAEGVDEAEERLVLFGRVADAVASRAAVIVPAEPPEPDRTAHAALVSEAEQLHQALASVRGQQQAVEAELVRARDQAAQSTGLADAGDCPLCGQALGDAYERVQQHRAAEVADAESRLAAVAADHQELSTAVSALVGCLDASSTALDRQEADRAAWLQAGDRRAQADAALERAVSALQAHIPGLLGPAVSVASVSVASVSAASVSAASVTVASVTETLAELRRDTAQRREAATLVAQLRGRLERRPALEAALAVATDRAEVARAARQRLLGEVETLGFDTEAMLAATQAHDDAAVTAAAATKVAQEALLAAIRHRSIAEAEARALALAREQHAKLAGLEAESRHLGRVADLLSQFRNTVVASVGPRLALQAAELFGELTDHEYDELQVDPETYQLQISDAGRTYGLERFSGSEIDLANLALRVAISEHVRFQSGGSVGLLVLDEVFGPLDEDRKARMLLALERLRGRFRQVLVVTHDANVKEQLPNAIEVIKRPGRRATARVVNA